MQSILLGRIRQTDLEYESPLPSEEVGPSFLSPDRSWPVCCTQRLLEFQMPSAGICDWPRTVNHMLMLLCLDWMRINIIIRKRPWRSHCGFKSLREQQQFREKRLIKRIREFEKISNPLLSGPRGLCPGRHCWQNEAAAKFIARLPNFHFNLSRPSPTCVPQSDPASLARSPPAAAPGITRAASGGAGDACGPALQQHKESKGSHRRLYGLFIASFRCIPVPTLSSTANKFRSGVHPRKGCTAKDPAPFCRHQQGSAGLHGPISIQHAASHGTGPGCINPGPEQSQQEELEICNVCLCGGA